MDDGARLWLAKTARANYWRVSRWYDLDDLIQEGYVAYYKTLSKYPSATDAPHRMALFKRIFLNRLHDMANQRTRGIQESCFSDMTARQESDGDQVGSVLDTVAAELGLEVAQAAFVSAPQYVKDAMALFAGEGNLARLRSGYRKMPRGKWLRRETLNERLCRLTGYDPEQTDIVGGIKACLMEE